jgi:hypothetical protein
MRRTLISHSLRLLLALGVTLLAGSPALAACSSYLGRVVFNEVFDKASTFVEIKTLDDTVAAASASFKDWTIELYKNNTATKTTVDFGSVFSNNGKNSCGTASRWIKVPDSSLNNYIANSNGASNLNFVLKDAAGAVVDIFRLATATTTASFYSGAGTLCPAIEDAISSGKYSAAWGSNGNKDWFRTPDGTGNWGGQATNANSDTSCKNNNTGTTVSAPLITTSAASPVGTSTATLNGIVNPGSGSTTVSFGYSSTSGSYTSTCSVATTYSGTTSQAFSCNITGLSCGTPYYFRASGTNTAATTNGSELSFTPACAASAGTFDAYETSYSSANAIANTAKIKTHVASNAGICVNGGACNLTIASFNAGKTALNTTFTGPVLVEIVNVNTGNGCTTATAIATVAAAQTLSGTGETTVTLPAVANAYANARIRVTYPATGTATAQNCSVDNFAIRPSSFASVSAQDATSSTAGSTNNLTNKVLATTTPIHKAGRPFSLNATAVNASSTTTTNYTGTPTAVVTACSAGTACIGVPGTLTTGASFVAGEMASTTASYNSVGAFSLNLQDTTFAAVDASDSSTAERYINSASALDVGRFVPDHFDTAVTTQGCSTFTYSGQPLTLSVTAKDATGNTLADYSSSGVAKAVTLSDANTVDGSFTSTSIAASSFLGGVSSVSPAFTYTNRSTAPLTIKLRATDVDGISSSTGTGGTSATAVEGGSTIVSGRVNLLNGYGSELLALPLTAKLEYYDTTPAVGWRQATSSYVDTCTNLAATNFAFTTAPACTTAVPSCITALSVNGSVSASAAPAWTVSLLKPTAAGGACITLNLDGAAAGARCTATGTPGATAATAAAPWLKYGWISSTASNPTASVTFGVYKSPIIYRRENY